MECTPCFYNQHHNCYHRWIGLGAWIDCECAKCRDGWLTRTKVPASVFKNMVENKQRIEAAVECILKLTPTLKRTTLSNDLTDEQKRKLCEPVAIQRVPDRSVEFIPPDPPSMLTTFKTIIREWPKDQQDELYQFMHDALNCRVYKGD